MDTKISEFFQQFNREQMHRIWQAAKSGDLDILDDEEKQFAEIMLDHEEEYGDHFSFKIHSQDYHYDPDKDEVNPFLHITFHSIIENQIKEREPIEAFQFYNAMLGKKMDRHDVIHLLANVFTPFLFDVMKNHNEFNLELYLDILRKCKKSKPHKVWDDVEREIDRYF